MDGTALRAILLLSINPISEDATTVRPAAERARGREILDARELLESNFALIEKAIAFAVRRNRLSSDDAEEFAAVVHLRLVENDYAILRKYEGRSSLGAYLSIVVQRILLDHRIHLWGKWHPSAEAKRQGALAVELEKLLHRDGRSAEEALTILRQSDPELTSQSLLALAAKLPPRAPKKREVDLEEAESMATEAPAHLASERRRLSGRVSLVVRSFLESLEPDDRLVLQLHFDGGMSVAEIARSMRFDQKLLYRRVEARLRELRKAIEQEGIAAAEVTNLIDDREALLDFWMDGPREGHAEEAHS